eukprot:1833142-Pyramimonas_sp.AAC.1
MPRAACRGYAARSGQRLAAEHHNCQSHSSKGTPAASWRIDFAISTGLVCRFQFATSTFFDLGLVQEMSFVRLVGDPRQVGWLVGGPSWRTVLGGRLGGPSWGA